PLARRGTDRFLERPAESGFGFITDRFRHYRNAIRAAQELSGGELHPPVREVLHRRSSDELREPLRKRRTRQADIARQGFDGPVTGGIAMQRRERASDEGIAQ